MADDPAAGGGDPSRSGQRQRFCPCAAAVSQGHLSHTGQSAAQIHDLFCVHVSANNPVYIAIVVKVQTAGAWAVYLGAGDSAARLDVQTRPEAHLRPKGGVVAQPGVCAHHGARVQEAPFPDFGVGTQDRPLHLALRPYRSAHDHRAPQTAAPPHRGVRLQDSVGADAAPGRKGHIGADPAGRQHLHGVGNRFRTPHPCGLLGQGHVQLHSAFQCILHRLEVTAALPHIPPISGGNLAVEGTFLPQQFRK